MESSRYAVWRQFWLFLYAAGLAAVVGIWWAGTGHSTAASLASVEIAIGNLSGLIGTYAILWQLVLMGRLTFLEDSFGMPRLASLHKWNGYAALILLLSHFTFLVLGFSITDHFSIIRQVTDFMFNWEDVLKSTLALAMLVGIVLMSIVIVRRRFKYETWYLVHLATYIAILLAFSHQFSVGPDFIGHPMAQSLWITMYVLSIGSLVLFRFVRPAWLLYRHRFTVAKVVKETHNVISIYVTGRQLDQLHFEPGQFMIWRFLSRDLWWQSHPFTLSAARNGKYLRLTVKMRGDYTRALAGLKPGTLVSVDGPHGIFTVTRFPAPHLLLIAGGVGITAIRSMLEQLPAATQSVEIVYAARTRADLALRDELEAFWPQRLALPCIS